MAAQAPVFTTYFRTWQESIETLCAASDLLPRIKERGRPVLIKPNLVENLAPPITTPVAAVAAIVRSLKKALPDQEIIIGEGCGATSYETSHVFNELGYGDLAAEEQIRLVDLNNEPLRRLKNPACRRWPEMHLPELLFEVFLLSVPVLKAHSLAGVTLTMKNMMGAAPPSHFQQGGAWKKAAFHTDIDAALFDLNRYRTPDFTILDATVGMQQAHLWGPTCDPPKNMVAAGSDPVAIDVWGTELLGFDWQRIDYLRMADGILGTAAYEEQRL